MPEEGIIEIQTEELSVEVTAELSGITLGRPPREREPVLVSPFREIPEEVE